MTTAIQMNDPSKMQVSRELLDFLIEYSRLLDQHVAMVRKILLSTVDAAMANVMEINAAADFKMMKAGEVLVKDKSSSFVSKNAKELDQSFVDPAAKVKHINESLSQHMSGLSNLDDSVRGFLFSIMGGLSVDDVVRQRLEHVNTSVMALQSGVQKIIDQYNSGGKVTEQFVELVQHEMLSKMYKSFTMEDEKKVFAKVFNLVPGINQKP